MRIFKKGYSVGYRTVIKAREPCMRPSFWEAWSKETTTNAASTTTSAGCFHWSWCQELKCFWYQGHSRSRSSTMQPLPPSKSIPKSIHLNQYPHLPNWDPRTSFPELLTSQSFTWPSDWWLHLGHIDCFLTGLNFYIKALDILLHQLNHSFSIPNDCPRVTGLNTEPIALLDPRR